MLKSICFNSNWEYFFSASLIVGICLFCNIKTEIKFVVSYPMREINASSMCITDKKVVSISEIENIIYNCGQNFLFEKINYIKMSYIYQNNGLASLLNETPSETAAFSQGFQNVNNNLNSIPHKGIFHPEPNTLICRGNCFYKYVGLYILL